MGALQRSCALFETGAMIPEVIFKGRIALDRLPTAVTFFPLECIAELHHASSSARLTAATREAQARTICARHQLVCVLGRCVTHVPARSNAITHTRGRTVGS